MAEGEAAGKRTCPECKGSSYVESAKDGGEAGDPERKRLFSGGYIRVMG